MKTKRIFAVLLTIVMALCAVTPTLLASAATLSLSADSYVSVRKDGLYKLAISGEGYLTVTAVWSAKGDRATASGSFFVLNSKKKDFDSYNSSIRHNAFKETKTKSTKLAVSKGTYYIQAKGIAAGNGGKIQLKYSFKSVKQPTNYSIGTALSLAAGKKTTIYQTQKYSFDRWFSIKLSKKQAATFTKTGSGNVELYDADGDPIEIAYNSSKSTGETSVYNSRMALRPGTYYVCVTNYKSSHSKTSIVTFKWN